MGRPTTQAQLEKLGFEVLALEGYHASLIYNGQRARLRGESAKELLEIAKGWIEHVVSTA